MRKFDFEKASIIIKEEINKGLLLVTAGLEDNDDSWATIYRDGRFWNPKDRLDIYQGIFAVEDNSDVPVMNLRYRDGKIKTLEMYIESDEEIKKEDYKMVDNWESLN
ncbi:hypothetical protein Bp8pS_039 [Bacillus phage vB_BpuM-BpSp]|nr:hypothetical protein Bp8pS_039 [Bacillus phage vB_BpuM-BpSp]